MLQKKSSNISNSTPSAATKKTASARNIFASHFGVAIVLLAAAVFAGLLWPQPVARVRVGERTFYTRVATNYALRQQGLSDSAPLRPDGGMLFAFPTAQKWQFWMKDMGYNIDIVWLDAAGTVVDVVRGATPQSYPHIFTPSGAARFVLELPPGGAQDVTYGDTVAF